MSDSSSDVPTRPSSQVPVALVWLGVAVVGFGTGFGAAYAQNWFAPVGVFPLVVGAMTGLAGGGVWNASGGGTRRAILISAAIAGLACTAMLHYGSYYASRKADEQRRASAPAQWALIEPNPDLPHPTLRTFDDYMTREWSRGRSLGSYRVQGAWLGVWWTLDAAAIVGAAMVAAVMSTARNAASGARTRPEAEIGPVGPNSGAAS